VNSRIYSAFGQELEKQALLERLVRLGATDVPGTPRLLMKQRGPQELKELQDSVEAMRDKHIAQPIMNVAEKGLGLLPAGRIQSMARSVAKTVASDPIGTTLSSAVPVPGAQAAYFGGKKLLENGIDRVFPLVGK
jgi:hypothetical protein